MVYAFSFCSNSSTALLLWNKYCIIKLFITFTSEGDTEKSAMILFSRKNKLKQNNKLFTLYLIDTLSFLTPEKIKFTENNTLFFWHYSENTINQGRKFTDSGLIMIGKKIKKEPRVGRLCSC